MKYHNPLWTQENVSEELLQKFCPYVIQEINIIEHLRADKNISKQMKVDLCLERAHGTLQAIKHQSCRFFQMAASKSYSLSGSKTKLQDKSACDYFQHPVFSHHVFRSSIFNTFRNKANEWERSDSAIDSMRIADSNKMSMFLPIFGKLNEINHGDKLLLNQNKVILNQVSHGPGEETENNTVSDLNPKVSIQTLHDNRPIVGSKSKRLAKANRLKRMSDKAKAGNTALHSMASGLKTILDICTEHRYGLNGGPALKDLELKYGSRWRNNKIGGSGRQHWNCRLCMHLELEHRMLFMSESEAISSLQKELDEIVACGRSKKPNIAYFNDLLKIKVKARSANTAIV